MTKPMKVLIMMNSAVAVARKRSGSMFCSDAITPIDQPPPSRPDGMASARARPKVGDQLTAKMHSVAVNSAPAASSIGPCGDRLSNRSASAPNISVPSSPGNPKANPKVVLASCAGRP